VRRDAVRERISHQEVLRDGRAVLAPGATISGLASDELRNLARRGR
jgi:hypothetical protein